MFCTAFRSNLCEDFRATMSNKLLDDCIANCLILSKGEIKTLVTSTIETKCATNYQFAATNGFIRDLIASLAVMLQLQPSNLEACSRHLKIVCYKERKRVVQQHTKLVFFSF